MNCNNQNVINLLTSKIFHDIGNVASFLNFHIELNKDNPESSDFNEIIDINKRIISQLKTLKCAFLDNAYGEDGLNTLKEYFSCKNVCIDFKVDSFSFTSDHLRLIANILMILEWILPDGSKVEIFHDENNLEIQCNSNEDFASGKLAKFDNLDGLDDINIYYINDVLSNMECELHYTVTKQRELTFTIKKKK